MFAALILFRFRKESATFILDPAANEDAVPMRVRDGEPKLAANASSRSPSSSLLQRTSWQPPDEVAATSLPLAKAVEKVLASMHGVLTLTQNLFNVEIAKDPLSNKVGEQDEVSMHLRRTRASEVRVVQGSPMMREPPTLETYNGRMFTAKHVNLARHTEKDI